MMEPFCRTKQTLQNNAALSEPRVLCITITSGPSMDLEKNQYLQVHNTVQKLEWLLIQYRFQNKIISDLFSLGSFTNSKTKQF